MAERATHNVFCTNCGEKNRTQSNFCFCCGNKLQKQDKNRKRKLSESEGADTNTQTTKKRKLNIDRGEKVKIRNRIPRRRGMKHDLEGATKSNKMVRKKIVRNKYERKKRRILAVNVKRPPKRRKRVHAAAVPKPPKSRKRTRYKRLPRMDGDKHERGSWKVHRIHPFGPSIGRSRRDPNEQSVEGRWYGLSDI